MRKSIVLSFLFCLFGFLYGFTQTNNIVINALLKSEGDTLEIQQEIDFFNTSKDVFNEIYLHNWANAYKDKNTPLAKRFIENYSKSFHFTSNKNRGSTTIHGISVNYDVATWEVSEKDPDILKINLAQPLNPNDSIKIIATYSVKIPDAKFTNYGVSDGTYNLKYWYLAPAIYDQKWEIYNNLDMDDLYIDYSNYTINIEVPNGYTINSNLKTSLKKNDNSTIYQLTGEKSQDVDLNITQNNDFIDYEFDGTLISTNLHSDKLNTNLKSTILRREFYFIQTFLGKFPHDKLLISQIEYDKNPVYGFNQLPSFLATYSDTFEWDIKLFKILSKKYIDEILLFNKRKDYWLADGLQVYLMLKYVEKYYPEVRAIGKISTLWGIKKFKLAQISFNEKYPFVYQFAARQNLDQPLTMQADSLSNFNRKIVNKYKSGLGISYLETYLDDISIPSVIWNFAFNNTENKVHSNTFLDLLKSKTKKEFSWFENEYLQTNKKIDYTIKKIERFNDSLEVSILNKRDFVAPIQLYGIKDKEIKFQQWLTDIDSLAKIKIPMNGFDKLSLNYEFLLPEYNVRNNWKNIKNKILNKPVQIKFFKDLEDPYYSQLFYTPVYKFNYYDGLVLGLALSNKTLLNKKFIYKVTPSYGTKSSSFSGSYSFQYEHLPENKKVNRLAFGIAGNNFHYAEDLRYNAVFPYALLEFKRKSLRDVSNKSIMVSYTDIDRERSPTQTEHIETNKYGVFNVGFGYSRPDIINDIRLSTGFQVSDKFSKVSLTGRYRKLTNTNRQFDFRFYAGAFLNNQTATDYFSFALDRPTDYLFQYEYLGRSETSGFFSQQIIINEGGFKSKLEVPFANQWLSTFNTSIGLWRWFEVYNDIGFVKNRNQRVYFAHENGIRLNFIQDILEVYFPLHSNLGWEISQEKYSSKIRFVLVINPKRIFNFVKRGFF
jgi:hypothetical protein